MVAGTGLSGIVHFPQKRTRAC